MSVRVPPRGTRGAPFPRFLAGLGNRFMLGSFRRKGGATTQGGLHALLLETTGAKSGRVRSVVLGYIEETPDSWLVIASAVGAARHPAWLFNLAKHPDATIEFGDGTRVEVQAASLEGEKAEAAWHRIAAEAPEYVRYRTKTDRDIPIVRLRRGSGSRSRPVGQADGPMGAERARAGSPIERHQAFQESAARSARG